MEELSLFKLNKKIQLLKVTETITISVSDWTQYTEGQVDKTIDLNPYGYDTSDGGVKCIVAPDYNEYDITNNLTELSKCSITTTATMSGKILKLTFIAEQNPTFEIKVIVQLMANSNSNDCYVISSFPIGDGGGGSSTISYHNVVSTNTLYPFYGRSIDDVLNYNNDIGLKTNNKNVISIQTPAINNLLLSEGLQQQSTYTLINSHIKKDVYNLNTTLDFPNNYYRQDIQFGPRSFFIGIRNINGTLEEYRKKTLGINFRAYKATEDSTSQLTLLGYTIKLDAKDIDIDNGEQTYIHANNSTLKIKEIKGIGGGNNPKKSDLTNFNKVTADYINASEAFELNGTNLFEHFKRMFGSQGTCTIGYSNDGFADYYTYAILPYDPDTSDPRTETYNDTVEARAERFYQVLHQALDANYKDILIMPGIYYLTDQAVEINKSNVMIRGASQATAIYWSETDLYDQNGADYGMFNIKAGNVTLKNMTIGYYLSYEAKTTTEGKTSAQSGYNNITYNTALIRLEDTGVVLDQVTFTSAVLQNGTTRSNINDNGYGFTYSFENGLRMNQTDNQHNNNATVNGSNRQYLLAQAVYVKDDKNLGVYNCVGSDEFTKYIVYRQTAVNCASTAVGCRCIARKPWYSMNIPCTGCTAFDSNVETTSNNTQGWESPGVFEINDH